MRWYFNPRTREGCDHGELASEPVTHISIHAPAKGATGCQNMELRQCKISIHAPAKGATLAAFPKPLDIPISIHAPAKGATKFMQARVQEEIFQSTHPRRVRQLA